MITIEETEVVGLKPAIRGMRNPYNSWSKSDSVGDAIGPADQKLATKLAEAGTDHGKLIRFIQVYADITGPLYWLKELDTYRVGVEKNSCSTMHNIASKEFTVDDFSHEHLTDISMYVLKETVNTLNIYRDAYLKDSNKNYWWQLIQLLPSSYNQKRTYMFSYAALRNIYHARYDHRLDEWHSFCDWIKTLPYSELITEDKID